MKKLIFTLLCCLYVIGAKADYNVNDLTYTDDNGTTWTYSVHEAYISFDDQEEFVLTQYSQITAVTGYPNDVVVPSSFVYNEVDHPVIVMSDNMFANSSLTSIQLPESLKGIPSSMFKNCNQLKSIDIPESVTSIGADAFWGCYGLTSVVIPEGVTSIGSYAFYNCTTFTGEYNLITIGLKSITLPSTLTFIGSDAFEYCAALEQVHISDIAAWCNIEFYTESWSSSYGMSNPLNNGAALYLNGSKITSLEIPNSVTTIPSHTFAKAEGITSVTIPSSVTVIGEHAFDGCADLTTVTMTNAVTTIGEYAFQNCKNLESITLSDQLLTINNYTFRGCEKLVSINLPASVKRIGEYAFSGCKAMKSITLPSSLQALGNSAFQGCSGLQALSLPNSITNVGTNIFGGCTGLQSIDIPASVTSLTGAMFTGCENLTAINVNADNANYTSADGILFDKAQTTLIRLPQGFSGVYTVPTTVTAIGNEALRACKKVTDVVLHDAVATIGDHAFYGTNLREIVLPESITAIGTNSFYGIAFVRFESATPLTINGSEFSNQYIAVPQAAVSTYRTAWPSYASYIVANGFYKMNLTLTAQSTTSDLYAQIEEENLSSVVDLTLSGTLNSYDIIIIRNKMPLLRYLDLTDVTFVNSNYPYYGSYCTRDSVVGSYCFSELDLVSVVLPKNTKQIGYEAFQDCDNLTSIKMWSGLKRIESSAFYNCNKLKQVDIPLGVERIGDSAFGSCHNLDSVTFPPTLMYIGYGAFQHTSLRNISLPNGLLDIDSYAFSGCSQLKEIRIPSSVRYIGDGAFANNTESIQAVYTYTVEPTAINQNTFSCYETAKLYVPTTSYYNYYWQTQWSQFNELAEFDEPYEYFYINNDYTIGEEKGEIDGTPNADLNAGSGLIVEGNVDQKTDTLNIHHNGGHGGDGVGGSIIAGDNLHANKVHFRINVKGGQWHFFAFPFNIKKENIQCEGGADWVFHYYDGKERANNGKGGWKKVTSEEGQGNFLKAGMGYIFQSSKDDVLVITVDEDNDPDEEGIRFDKENKSNAMEAHASQNEQDASWNFMGNPHLSYYDLDAETYDAPITVWDGEKYVAVRPGDDEYQLAPFQAFFVQKPNGVDKIEFKRDNQMTHQQKENKAATASAYARTRSFDGRLIVNITLSDDNHSDNTRVVFNDARKMDYERACDAAKFASAGVPQLYTLDSRKVKYAINERPQEEGSVAMGYSVPAYGSYTIDAPRMDTPMVLKDLLTGIIHDFDEGSYSFASEAGTFDNRFVLMTRAAATGMDIATLGHIQVSATEGGIGVSQLGGATLNVFTTAGEKVASTRTDGVIAVTAGIYMVEADGKSVKVVVK